MEKKKEKYLTIQLLGKNGLRVNAWKVKEKVDNGPDFVGDGVAVWVNTKKDKPLEVKEEII